MYKNIPEEPEEVTKEHLEITKAVLFMFKEAVEENEPYAQTLIQSCREVNNGISMDPKRTFYLD